jgi:hypothetical protein
MTGDCHSLSRSFFGIRFCENVGVKFPCVTRLVLTPKAQDLSFRHSETTRNLFYSYRLVAQLESSTQLLSFIHRHYRVLFVDPKNDFQNQQFYHPPP